MNMRYDFKVKADAKGKFFLAELRENLNRNKCYLRVRANGNRAEHAIADGLGARGYDQDLPIRYATEYRVYLIEKGELVV